MPEWTPRPPAEAPIRSRATPDRQDPANREKEIPGKARKRDRAQRQMPRPLRRLRREQKKLAESEGFEPSVPVTQYGSLANCWFQPLTHDSEQQQTAGYREGSPPLQPAASGQFHYS